MSEELKPFKISDQVKPTVDKPRASKAAAQEQPAAGSAGFPNIEALVESAAADLSGLDARHAQLEEMAKGKGSPKDKAAAKKAAGAYGKARNLIEYLLETKQKMAGGSGPA